MLIIDNYKLCKIIIISKTNKLNLCFPYSMFYVPDHSNSRIFRGGFPNSAYPQIKINVWAALI